MCLEFADIMRFAVSEDMSIFRFFKMATLRHLGFLTVENFTCLAASKSASIRQISCRSVKPFRRYRHISIFQYSGRPPFCFFKSWEILTSRPVRRPNVRYHAEFHADWSHRCEDIADFRFFKMAAVRHLRFVLRVYEEYLVVFVIVQNLNRIGAVISTLCKF